MIKKNTVVELESFIQATRDSGYRGLPYALAELIDNAIEANASNIEIKFVDSKDIPNQIDVQIIDNGKGMDRDTLAQALRFGWSSKFNSRNSMGRYGMGLPNGSLSQSRRVEIYTWKKPQEVWYTYLDMDDVIQRKLKTLPEPLPAILPLKLSPLYIESGTVIIWKKCDRIDRAQLGKQLLQIRSKLGRIFRYYIKSGKNILLNENSVSVVDPLFLSDNPQIGKSYKHGETLQFNIDIPNNAQAKKRSLVEVQFVELPVKNWHTLPNEEKRKYGISKGAGVSIVRSLREIDHGWFFMGDKRRENYDDWWRCEIRFDPELDELFGVTHTKQQIHPTQYLIDILTPDLSEIGRKLNNKIRKEHEELRALQLTKKSEASAIKAESFLKPIPFLRKKQKLENGIKATNTKYVIKSKPMNDPSFYKPIVKDGQIIIILNSEHPFYTEFYGKVEQIEKQPRFISQLELLLLSHYRAELTIDRIDSDTLKIMRNEWSDVLATFLRELK